MHLNTIFSSVLYNVRSVGSPINHSFEPNVAYRFRQTDNGEVFEVYAMRDIASGEELFNDYHDEPDSPQWYLEWLAKKDLGLTTYKKSIKERS